jgi:hypothetical protein
VTVEPELEEYRQHLVLADQKAIEDYDKAVMALSGGALGVSFAFLKDVAGARPWSSAATLFAAWLCWGVSIVAVLASYYFSHVALRRAIGQVDAGTIRNSTPGGYFTWFTYVSNALGGLLFLAGVVLIAVFVSANMGG